MFYRGKAAIKLHIHKDHHTSWWASLQNAKPQPK